MSAPPSLIGTTLDTYEIHALLGSGHMAAVYTGFRVISHHPLVAGVLPPALAAAAYFARPRQEAWHVASQSSGAQRR